MNDIVRPLTPDGMVGWDEHGQLWLWEADGDSRRGTIIGDPREHKCPMCGQGWALTAESLKDQQRSMRFDEWWHLSCAVRFAALRERDMWYWGLAEARVRFHALKETTNGYWRNDPVYSKRPWYRAEAMDGPYVFELGRRKRVYHIGVLPKPGHALDGSPLAEAEFEKENVTKRFAADGWLLHAWSDDDARGYLKRVSRVLGLDEARDRKPPTGGA